MVASAGCSLGFGTISPVVSVYSLALFEMKVVPAGGLCARLN